MQYFILVQTNIENAENMEEETIENDVINVWGMTALEVLATVTEYTKPRGFNRVGKMVWSNGFDTHLTLVGN